MHDAARNLAWLVADKGVRLVVGVLVGFWMARYLGPSSFGTLAYALAVVTLVLPLAEMGVDAVARRQILAKPEEAGAVLHAARCLRVVAAIIGYGLVICWGLSGSNSAEERRLLVILGLTLFQPAGMVADLWLQANLRARSSVVAQWIAVSIGAILRVALILLEAPLLAFGWAILAETAMVMLFVTMAARCSGVPHGRLAMDLAVARELLQKGWPLLVSGIAVVLYMRIDMVMLRTLAGEEPAGIYAAAVRISELGYFLPIVLASSVLPALLRSRMQGSVEYTRRLQQFYDLNAILAYLLAGTTALISGWLIRAAYGTSFAAAAPVLAMHAWAGIFVFLGVARGQFLVNEDLGRFYVTATCVGATANVGLNLWLIPLSGAKGAAQATLISYALSACVSSWFHPAVRANAAMQLRALLIPVLGWRYFRRT